MSIEFDDEKITRLSSFCHVTEMEFHLLARP